MTRLWLIGGSVLTVAALGWGTLQAISVLAHQDRTETVKFDASGITSVDIHNGDGTTEVRGGDVEEITLVAEISDGLVRTGHRAEVEGSSLVVRSNCSFLSTWCGVDYSLVVPRDMAVDVDADNGRVTLIDLDGDVDADGDNGRVELIRLTGNLRASSDNGSVTGEGLRTPVVVADTDNGRVSLSFAEPPRDVTATSDNGRVEVVVPNTADTYRVDAQTDNGSTDIAVRTDPTSPRVITAETDNGSVSVRYASG